jgi:hypothetical protein
MDSTKRACSVSGCKRKYYARGFCELHYKRLRKYGNPEGRISEEKPRVICSVPDCEQSAVGRGWCNPHYMRWYKHGDPLAGGAPRVSKGSGSISNGGYRVFNVGGEMLLEHRLVMQRLIGRPLRHEEHVHHIDGDKLNNDPGNLQIVSPTEHISLHFEMRTHCRRGHPLDEKNTYRKKDGRRECRRCHADREQARRLRRN